jgi:hypothetical protein
MFLTYGTRALDLVPGFGGSENATRARDPAPLAPRFRSHQSRVLRDRRSSDRPGGLPSATHTGTRRYASLRPVGRMNRKGPCIPARWIVAQRYRAPGGIRDLPLPSRPRRSECLGSVPATSHQTSVPRLGGRFVNFESVANLCSKRPATVPHAAETAWFRIAVSTECSHLTTDFPDSNPRS